MMPRGFVIYRGPSMIDAAPIVAIALSAPARAGDANVKTGNVMQTYILRADYSPSDAIKVGADVSICGDCKHRGDGTGKGRTCYVTLMHGPRSVYASFRRGNYPDASPADVARMAPGRVIRLGTYGDPAAVPISTWRALLVGATGWTGYTHQWKTRPAFQDLCMASVDTPSERAEAIAAGWRTFTVRAQGTPIPSGDISCPASAEMGKRTTCAECRLCAGTSTRAKSITILAHGSGRKYFDTLTP